MMSVTVYPQIQVCEAAVDGIGRSLSSTHAGSGTQWSVRAVIAILERINVP